MAGRISRQFIDDLLSRADIVELVDSRVPLKKAGKNHQACCPFHNEKSPSFTVSQDKQFYHCFGCGEHGNAISFLMEFDRLDFVDAVEELASHCGMEVIREENNTSPQEQRRQQIMHQQKQDDYELLGQISRFYQQQLKVASDKEVAIDYLKGRGLSGEVVKRFGIGYISNAWDGMMNTFSRNGQANQQLIDLGMAISGDKNRPYDRFRGRIMFPIHDKRGRVIGFGGRVLGDEKPKYLNSPETRIYHKGQELYGLHEAKQANKQLKRLVVVEGYMDVVALAQHGVDYAVASLGTATTFEQLQTLFRTVPDVICCYDGDRAGRDAAWRAMENALPLIRDGFSLRFVFVPDGEDPDSLIRTQGQESFERLLEDAMPLSTFMFDKILEDNPANSTEAKVALIDTLQPYIKKMPDSILKNAMIDEMASRFSVTSEKRMMELQKLNANPSKKAAKTNTKVTPVRLALALLLEHPHIATSLNDIRVLQPLNAPGIPLLIHVLDVCQKNPEIKTPQILEYFRGTTEGEQLSKLMCWEHHIEADAATEVFLDSVEKLLNNFVEQRTEVLLQKARAGQMTAEEKQELQALLNA